MAKYIDAELLRKKIDKRMTENRELAEKCVLIRTYECFSNRASEDNNVLAIIDFLQQEQESVAERFARIVRENLIGIDKEVQQKFEQLYFEVTGNKMYGGYND